MRHPTTCVKFGKLKAEIDILLAPLIYEMWQSFIVTEESCQEWDSDDYHVGMSWIVFPNEYELKKFLNIVACPLHCKYPKSLYRRINPPYDYKEDIPQWDFMVMVSDDGIGEAMADFRMVFHVFFPQSDIPLLLQRLREHNENYSADGAYYNT